MEAMSYGVADNIERRRERQAARGTSRGHAWEVISLTMRHLMTCDTPDMSSDAINSTGKLSKPDTAWQTGRVSE